MIHSTLDAHHDPYSSKAYACSMSCLCFHQYKTQLYRTQPGAPTLSLHQNCPQPNSVPHSTQIAYRQPSIPTAQHALPILARPGPQPCCFPLTNYRHLRPRRLHRAVWRVLRPLPAGYLGAVLPLHVQLRRGPFAQSGPSSQRQEAWADW